MLPLGSTSPRKTAKYPALPYGKSFKTARDAEMRQRNAEYVSTILGRKVTILRGFGGFVTHIGQIYPSAKRGKCFLICFVSRLELREEATHRFFFIRMAAPANLLQAGT